MADLAATRRAPHVRETSFLRALPPLARYILRADPQVQRAAGAVLGLQLSRTPCRATSAADRAALWLGPDEQLLLFAPTEAAAMLPSLQHALASLPHALVEVSHRQIALELSGPPGVAALNEGCPLDLDPVAFPVGMCTRTVLARAEIILWRTAEERFHLEVWRSFSDYVSRFLAAAGQAA